MDESVVVFGCEDAGRNVSDEGGGVLAPKFQGITGDLSRIGPRTRTSILRGHSSYYYHHHKMTRYWPEAKKGSARRLSLHV